MTDVILSSPAFYLYLVVVGVLLVAALRNRRTGPPVRETGPTTPTTLRPSEPSSRPGAVARPFPDLQADLSARYASKLEQAIRTIRD